MRKSERVLAGKRGKYRKERWRHRKKRGRERETESIFFISLSFFSRK